ncbi:hypothetical protein HPB50_000599 [Hyalomma asiaticum]|uniref:Uncharacterized protein n=1 Tax=Hyalomma asiaticum TaxID=266040 RepID=A0ACB7RGQ3_HYAAI|nr:hypothetical protein HPB50_000599 [Hyalomma asiaticum]
MAFFAPKRPPVAFGYPLPGLASPGYPWDGQGVVRSHRFRLDWPRHQGSPPADVPNVKQAGDAEGQNVVPPSGAVPDRGARSSAPSGVSLTTGTELSSSRRSSKHSDSASKSECSSLAPYWVPDEIKHYFRHRHSASDEDDSSGKVDAALQAIGRERELPTIDSGDWPRRKFCRKPLHALLVAMAAITAALLVLLIVAISTKYRIVPPGSGRWQPSTEGDDAVGAHVANENGDDLPTSADREEDLRVGVFQEAPNDVDSRSTHLKEKDKSCDDDESTAKRRVKAKHRAAVGGFEPEGNSRIWACASTGQRPFYIFGHMANSLADVDDFVNQGANAIEADLTFASVGTPQLFYHGALCDCGRHCEKSARVHEYLSYLSDAVKDGGKFAGKLQLLYIDIKAANIPWGTKYQAGINLATDLIRYLWKNGTVPPEFMLNVILSVSTTSNKDVLWGARDTLQRVASSSLFMDHVGFDISGYELLDIIAATYEELGIRQHRWQGDGTSNCLIDGYWDARTRAVISRRTATNSSRDYVDKAYVWTVDRPNSVRRFLR